MAKTREVQTFSADAIAKIAAAVRRLNNEPRNRPPRERQWPGYTKRGHMWGTTAVCTEFPDYPLEIDAPNTYCVRLQEWHFREVPGQQPVSMIDWEQCIVARAVANVGETQPYLPEGTGVEVWPVATRRGIRWWLRASSEINSSSSSSESSDSESSDSESSESSEISSDSSSPSSIGNCPEVSTCAWWGRVYESGLRVWVGYSDFSMPRCRGIDPFLNIGCDCVEPDFLPEYDYQVAYTACNQSS